MSVYSRCVEARGTTTIESTPAFFQPSKPVLRSRYGSGPSCGEPGDGVSDEPLFAQYGATVKPYSDCTPSAGTTGLGCGTSKPPPLAVSLSSATVVITRLSTPWT